MEYETIDTSQIDEIMEGKKPSPPEGWDDRDKPQGGQPDANDDLKEADVSASDRDAPKGGEATTH